MLKVRALVLTITLGAVACKARTFSDVSGGVQGNYRCEGFEPSWALSINTSKAYFKGNEGEFVYPSGQGRRADGGVVYELAGERAQLIAHISKETCIDRGHEGPQAYKLGALILNGEEIKGLCCDLTAGAGATGTYSCSRTEPAAEFKVNSKTASFEGLQGKYSFVSGVGRSYDGGYGWELTSNGRPDAHAGISPNASCTNRNEEKPNWTHEIQFIIGGKTLNGCCVAQ